MGAASLSGAWNPEKVEAFRSAFYEFLNHVNISSKELGQIVLGEHLYYAQHMFYEAVFGALSRDIHDISVLKSRQLGISTGTRALTLFWLGMHDGLRGTMVFDTAFNTQAARREIEEILDGLPSGLGFPRIKSRNRDVLTLENDSWLIFTQAGTKNARSGGGLGRSLGINLVHASEICSWVNEEGLTSFRQSLAESYPDRLYIWESTGRGYNVWYDLWQEAKEDPFTKATVFIGWWAKDNQQIAREDVRFSIYGAEPPDKRETERIIAVRDQYGWDITPEQLAWYRWKTDPLRERDEKDPEDSNQTQEQPFTEAECFQATGSTFFSSEKLGEAISRAATGPKPQYFRFWPGMDFVTCDIKPARNKREVELRLWEEPAQNAWYVVAADPAFGHNEKNDNSAAQVLRCYADAIEQVAEYASATIQPHHFAWLLWTLVGYFGSKPGNQVMPIIEINGPGEEVWRQFQATRQIVENGYLSRIAREKGIGDIFSNARTYMYQRSDSFTVGHSAQFKTATQLKVQTMEACRNYLHSGTLIVRSLESLEEMRTITRDGDTIAAEGHKRDDRTYALAMGVRAWDDKIRRGMIAGNRTREAERAKLSMSIQDQVNLFQRNHLAAFFDTKQRTRSQQMWVTQQRSWRAGQQRRWR